MRRALWLTALSAALLAVAALPAAARTATGRSFTRCEPDLTLRTLQYTGTGEVSGRRTPVHNLRASGLSCPAARRLFSGATVPISGGGANQGVAWGRRLSQSPTGWHCALTVGYWAARHHADTLDWVHGWSELCRATGRSISFTEGTQTPWRFHA